MTLYRDLQSGGHSKGTRDCNMLFPMMVWTYRVVSHVVPYSASQGQNVMPLSHREPIKYSVSGNKSGDYVIADLSFLHFTGITYNDCSLRFFNVLTYISRSGTIARHSMQCDSQLPRIILTHPLHNIAKTFKILQTCAAFWRTTLNVMEASFAKCHWMIL